MSGFDPSDEVLAEARRIGPARFQIRIAGAFRLLRNGEVVVERSIGSKKGRTLLKLLALNAGTAIPTDRIIEALWGEAPPARPEDNVATLVSRLRGVLGAETIDGGRNGYSLRPGPYLDIDVFDAERLTAEAEARFGSSEPTLSRVAAERATKLLGSGRILEDEPDVTWADEAREAATLLVRRARRCLWLSALELSDHPTALEAATSAIKVDELDEEAHRAVMLANYRGGEQGAALAAFERLRRILAEEIGADPAPETEALHIAILRNEEPTSLAVPPSREVVSHIDPGFVGRDGEVAALSQRWADASMGSAALILIIGEAGIGKSRLALEIARLADATGGLVLQSRCYQAERSLFLQPVAEAIRSAVITLHPDETLEAAGEWAGTLGEFVPEIAQVLRPINYDRGPAPVERRRALEAVTSFFQKLSRQRPVLLIVDDLHLAGAATVELLHFMTRRLEHDRLLIIGTVRPEETADHVEHLTDVSESVSLGPLREDAVNSLARQTGAADLASELMEKTGGHTLFVVEALRAIAEAENDERFITIPNSLRNIIVSRVKRLGTETERFLRTVVVLGSAFELEVATQLTGLSLHESLRHAECALQARLIVQSGLTYEFANDLIREVIYGSTPVPSRIALHRQAAVLIEGNPEASATHWIAGGEWNAAAAAWLEAAGVAAGSFANRDAARLLGQAVDAASNSGDQLLLTRAYVARSRVLEILGEYQAAFADASDALEIAQEEGNTDLEAEALERLAWIAHSSRYDEKANDLAGRASELSERALEAPGACPSAVVLAARLRHSKGDLKGAHSLLEDALSGELDDATRAGALSCLGGTLEHGDRFEEAVRTLEVAARLCRKTKNLRHLINALFFAGMAHGNLGKFSRALSTFDGLSRIVEESDSRSYRARVANCRSWIYRELGDIARARDFAEEATDRAAELGEVEPRAHAALALAECSLLENDHAEAWRMIEQGSLIVRGRDVGFSWRLELREAELRSRLEPQLAEELIELARRYASRKYEALGLAHLGRHEEAISIAAPLGSDYLSALVGHDAVTKAAIDRLALGLPEELRGNFVARGRLSISATRPP